MAWGQCILVPSSFEEARETRFWRGRGGVGGHLVIGWELSPLAGTPPQLLSPAPISSQAQIFKKTDCPNSLLPLNPEKNYNAAAFDGSLDWPKELGKSRHGQGVKQSLS